MALIEKVHDVRYHRNGISGEGFYVVDFQHRGERLLGIVFPNEENTKATHYAVVTPSDGDQKWRGDWFVEEMLEAIREAGDTAFGTKGHVLDGGPRDQD